MNTKNIILALVLAVAIAGGYFFPQAISLSVGTSATGSTFNTAKFAGIVMAPATTAATSSSILNTDANDRYVQSASANCGVVGNSFTYSTGAGLASFTLVAATTSSSSVGGIPSNTNLTMNVAVSTSSVDSANATSTYGTAFWQRWAANSYMTFTFNATNTAVCTVGVNYVGS